VFSNSNIYHVDFHWSFGNDGEPTPMPPPTPKPPPPAKVKSAHGGKIKKPCRPRRGPSAELDEFCIDEQFTVGQGEGGAEVLVTPEASTLHLLGSGLVGLVYLRRRISSRQNQ